MRGEFSGGTFKTLMNSLRNPPPKSQLGYDPLVKQIGKKEKVNKNFKSFNQKMMGYNSEIKAWTGMWALADGNAAIVRRTQALTEIYSNDLIYCESARFPNFISAFNFYFGLVRDGTMLANSWLSEFYYRTFITQPGTLSNSQAVDPANRKWPRAIWFLMQLPLATREAELSIGSQCSMTLAIGIQLGWFPKLL